MASAKDLGLDDIFSKSFKNFTFYSISEQRKRRYIFLFILRE